MRACAGLLLLAAAAFPQSVESASLDLRKADPVVRRAALRFLVEDQSPEAARAIILAMDAAFARVSGLRYAMFERQRAVDDAYAHYDAVWDEHQAKIDRFQKGGGGTKRGRDLNRELSTESRERKARLEKLEGAYEPFRARYEL